MFLTFLDGKRTQNLSQALGRCSRVGRIVCSQGMWRKRTSLWQEKRGRSRLGSVCFGLCSDPGLLF